MNKIKAILHNKVLIELAKQYHNTDYIVVDQFAKEFVYYSYLRDSKEVCRGITFTTKAEDKCLSVACASMISRFIFIKEFDKLGQSLDMFLPKGAGTAVDEVAKTIKEKYGISKLKQNKEISDYDKYKPWNEGEFSGKLEYRLDSGKKYERLRLLC